MEGRDLLRVFPPWLEGTAGPDLAVCRLAGSIVTLSRRGRAAKRLKRTGRLGRTHMSAGGGRRRGGGGTAYSVLDREDGGGGGLKHTRGGYQTSPNG